MSLLQACHSEEAAADEESRYSTTGQTTGNETPRYARGDKGGVQGLMRRTTSFTFEAKSLWIVDRGSAQELV